MKQVRDALGVAAVFAVSRKDLLSETVQLLHQMFQSMDLFSRRMLRDFGVTSPQLWALRTIDAAGVLSMSDVAQGMHLHLSTVTGIVDRLESSKLVTRERSTADGRVKELRLTAKGRAILARAPEPPRSKAARRLGRLRPAELRQVHASLRILTEAMDLPLTEPED